MDDPYTLTERVLAVVAYIGVPLLAVALYFLIGKALL